MLNTDVLNTDVLNTDVLNTDGLLFRGDCADRQDLLDLDVQLLYLSRHPDALPIVEIFHYRNRYS